MPRGTGPSRRSLHRHKKLAKLEGDQDDKNWSSSSSSTSDDDRADRPNLADSENDGEAVEQGDEARLHDGECDESSSDGEENDDSENDGEAVEQGDEARLHDEECDESSSDGEENDDADEARQASDVEDGDIRVLQDEGDQEDEELIQEEDDSSSSSESSDSDESEVEESDEEENLSSGEDNEDEVNEEANVGDVPLYPNARITLMESLVMLLTLSLRFSLTGECLLHILELIEMHCPVGNVCKTTLYKFKSYFVEIGRKALVLHYYCEHCMSALEGKNSVCERCGDRTILAFFIEIPLLSQLQKLFLREGFVQKLMYRFDRIKKHEGNFEDLYDGDLYKEQMANGFLSSRFNISFTWYSDGIQIFKSSKYCVWPLFFCINELSYKERTKKENILLCGLWFGKSKPRPNLFLNPFQTTFERFKNEGYHFNVPNSNVPILVKALLLFGTCDLQAKALFLRCKLYNAYYGCCNCYSRGQRFPAGRTTVHVHPYTEPRNVKLRKNKDVLKCARNARETGRKHCLGIKGLSLLYFMMPDMIRGTGLDIMHMVFLGVCKLLSKFWFDSKFSNEPFSCSAMVDIINRRLSSIYPPSFVQRMTRNLTDLRLWKAKEFKLFFFYYSIPVLNGILPREYLVHHLKLVSALALLCQDSIFPEQVDRAGDMLLEYIRDFQRLYGLRYMGMNVHGLAHLAQAVRTFGPLWVLSCFFLEDLNGQLVKLIHAPYLPGIQICSSASLFMSLRSQIEKLHPHSVAKMFCLKLHQMFANYKLAEVINEKMCVTGKKAYQLGVPAEIIEFVRGQLNIENGHFMSFSTLRKRGIFFNSSDRALRGKRCSQFACFDKDGVPILGKIRYFLRCSECNCLATCECLPALFLCVVDVYERSVWLPLEVQNVSIFHLFAVAPKNESLVLSCDQIKCVCFYMNFDGAEYLATPINSVEYE